MYELLRAGTPNKEIAEELGISVNTVRHHVRDLLRKLGFANRIELLAHALSALH